MQPHAAGHDAVSPRSSIEAGIGGLLAGASVEISARDPLAGAGLRELLAPGTAVFVNFAAGDTHHGAVAAAARLRRAGFEPVPHVAARHLLSFTQLNDYLARAAGEAGVTQALVVGGDSPRPAGPYDSALQILETGLFEKHGIGRVLVGGYPEGHPRIAADALDRALADKIARVRAGGGEAGIVTQFGFEARPIVEWIARQRARGLDAPVRVGLAGPASVAALSKYAVRCGVGNSLRALMGGQSSIARLLVEAGPEPAIRDLAEAARGGLGLAGLHFFTFGGIGRTAAMLRSLRREAAA